ncbi:MAG: DUF3341 domain-containing protein [Bdellovibrionales bacterium]|nr:DUF3341 domain-containing protein [Bdellovibrionales bacterium]
MATTKGTVAYFRSGHEVLAAAQAATKKGFRNVEAYTPFPIHGMDDALGIKPSIVPWATLTGGLVGLAIATHMQIWTSAFSWPINVGGKPLVSMPAFIPVMFELTVLLGGLSTVAFMFYLNGLPNTKPNPLDPKVTDDRFALYIPAEGQASEAEGFLRSLNPESVAQVMEQI